MNNDPAPESSDQDGSTFQNNPAQPAPAGQPAQPYPHQTPAQPQAYPGQAQPYPQHGGANQPPQYPGNQYAPQQPPPRPYAAPPGYGGAPQQYRPIKPFSGKATASVSIAGGMFFLLPLGVIGNIVGLVLGIIAMKDTKEPGGKYRGRGLAIGGVVSNIVVWLISVAVVGLFVAMFALIAEQDGNRHERRQQAEAEREQHRIDTDLDLIASRVNLYYIENSNSLEAGGPIVTDGGIYGLYAEDHPKVEGRLELKHLIHEYDLEEGGIYSYRLTITGKDSVEIEHISSQRTLVVSNVRLQTMSYEDR